MTFRCGTQSWQFLDWVGPFYPPGTKRPDMLRLYATAFKTLEVDATFYGIPPEPILVRWRREVPEDFVFALKLPQEITHARHLAGGEEILHRFLDRVRLLEGALGPLLVQLSPGFVPSSMNRDVLRAFLAALPRDVRWAVEFRHREWLSPETLDLLRENQAALALVEGRWIRRGVFHELALSTAPTADFAYVRWMGTDGSVTGFSRPGVERRRELEDWARVLRHLGERVGTIFGYFNNHFQGHAPHSVRAMMRLMGQEPVEPSAMRVQEELFQ